VGGLRCRIIAGCCVSGAPKIRESAQHIEDDLVQGIAALSQTLAGIVEHLCRRIQSVPGCLDSGSVGEHKSLDGGIVLVARESQGACKRIQGAIDVPDGPCEDPLLGEHLRLDISPAQLPADGQCPLECCAGVLVLLPDDVHPADRQEHLCDQRSVAGLGEDRRGLLVHPQGSLGTVLEQGDLGELASDERGLATILRIHGGGQRGLQDASGLVHLAGVEVEPASDRAGSDRGANLVGGLGRSDGLIGRSSRFMVVALGMQAAGKHGQQSSIWGLARFE
jgi:hypothetical protein